jgi:hypothetical protein
MCRGNKFVIDPRKTVDGPCPTCGGTGTVNIEFRCRCGRPAVIPVADTVVCTFARCREIALGGIK